MGGVDLMDQQLHGIQVLRKTYKWYQKIFFRMVMLALLSSQNFTNLGVENLNFCSLFMM